MNHLELSYNEPSYKEVPVYQLGQFCREKFMKYSFNPSHAE